MSIVGWYVDIGSLRNMTYDRYLFNRFQEQEGGMRVELGVGSISFHMPSGYFFELDSIIFVSMMKKNLLPVSCMIDVQWIIYFEGHPCTINDCSLVSPRTLDRGLREGGIHRFLYNIVEIVYSNGRLEMISSFEEAHAC
jgi:hypothetical protein